MEVRNPEYQDALSFLGRVLDLAMVVNPEQAAAEEIFRVLHFPAAINVDTFSNPEYQDALSFLGRVLDLAMVVNPEQAAAEEIFRVLHFPAAINVDTFSRGSSEILKFRIRDNSPLDGMPVRDVVRQLHATGCCTFPQPSMWTPFPEAVRKF